MSETGAGPLRKHGFAPVFREDATLLVLGSLPGDASLATARYYAHPRNRFWHLMGDVIDETGLPEWPYEARLERLLDAGVALWDAAISAERKGSLDTAIRSAKPAPLAQFSAAFPDLRAVAFNGKKAASLGRPQLSGTALALIDLPSSSPAHAAMPYTEKQRKWSQLRNFVR